MKKLTATLCLTLTIFLGNIGVSEGADLQKGITAYESGDYATALREWKPLAEQGDADAQFNLGGMYDNGWGVPENDKTAVKWYTLAAEQGHADAQYNLGQMYDKGQGVPQNLKTAAKWYRLAADQGLAEAQYNLGNCYRLAEGVPQDYNAAVKWFRLAAQQGYAPAQTDLGLMYVMGQGVKMDLVCAYFWGNKGASNGNENGAKLRHLAANNMTPSQLEKAEGAAGFQRGAIPYQCGDYATAVREWTPVAKQGDAKCPAFEGIETKRGIPWMPRFFLHAFRWSAELRVIWENTKSSPLILQSDIRSHVCNLLFPVSLRCT